MIDKAKLLRLRPLLDHPMWEAFEEVLKDELQSCQSILDTSDVGPILYRAQGKKASIAQLLSLKDIARRKDNG